MELLIIEKRKHLTSFTKHIKLAGLIDSDLPDEEIIQYVGDTFGVCELLERIKIDYILGANRPGAEAMLMTVRNTDNGAILSSTLIFDYTKRSLDIANDLKNCEPNCEIILRQVPSVEG